MQPWSRREDTIRISALRRLIPDSGLLSRKRQHDKYY
jgi:hypothetical protein